MKTSLFGVCPIQSGFAFPRLAFSHYFEGGPADFLGWNTRTEG